MLQSQVKMKSKVAAKNSFGTPFHYPTWVWHLKLFYLLTTPLTKALLKPRDRPTIACMLKTNSANHFNLVFILTSSSHLHSTILLWLLHLSFFTSFNIFTMLSISVSSQSSMFQSHWSFAIEQLPVLCQVWQFFVELLTKMPTLNYVHCLAQQLFTVARVWALSIDLAFSFLQQQVKLVFSET